jgi:hypothetical protein
MRRGESDESARGTVTAVAFRGPPPCLSQGLSMDSPEAVFGRFRDSFVPMLKTLQKFSYLYDTLLRVLSQHAQW